MKNGPLVGEPCVVLFFFCFFFFYLPPSFPHRIPLASLLPVLMLSPVCCRSYLPFCSYSHGLHHASSSAALSEAPGLLQALLHLSHFCGVLAWIHTCSPPFPLLATPRTLVYCLYWGQKAPCLESLPPWEVPLICALCTLVCANYSLL